MTISQVLAELRSSSLSAADKGRKFERLIQAWFYEHPVYKAELEKVWLWNEFPAKACFGDHDLGIDLVARTHFGEYWAIQCKFYEEHTRIDKAEVDSFISNSGREFTDPFTHHKTVFSERFWVSTNDSFSKYAEEMTSGQQINFHRITLDSLAASEVDWDAILHGKPGNPRKKSPLKHQEEALKKSAAHFARYDRGKLIMACGTGKSYTSLLIAEQEVKKGSVLVLVPSISLVNQMLNTWMADASLPIKPVLVCSDAKASHLKDADSAEGNIKDLPLPATTNSEQIAHRYLAYAKMLKDEPEGLVVIFSTYQSIDAVAEAQKAISLRLGKEHEFDLIICDEAHRTTGIIKPAEGHSDFTKVHYNDFIRSKKRLYMTATPRLYADNIKARACQSDYELCSMDDESRYGPEIHHVSFSYAISEHLLTDYKVLVLTVGSEHQLPEDIRKQVHDANKKELDFDLASRLVGCINGLAKNTTDADNALVWEVDPRIMKRAIAFCPNINKKGDPASSMNTAEQLPDIASSLFKKSVPDPETHKIRIAARHIDGSMDSAQRAQLLAWLGEDSPTADECRVLCNVRCLSEGIDVPALDAAIFLSPRNSQVDVVQSVGRVMRNFRKGHADEKKYGYIIIPVVVNPNVPAEEALNDNKAFAVVWNILNALRSHDERFEAMVNSIALNKARPVDKIVTSHTQFYDVEVEGDSDFLSEQEKKYAEELRAGMERHLSFLEDIDNKIYARMVEKVGSRLYWERWARDIAPLAANLIGRIRELVAMPGDLAASFKEFVQALRAAINNSVTETAAIEMLGQHMITRPVFEALFADYAFDDNNAVTGAMKIMVDKLIANGLEKDTAKLQDFYQSVKNNLGEVKTLSGRQTVIKNLYDSFFKGAFPKAVEQLGIVYTPVECVDFILHSVDAALRQEFGLGLTDKGVHILDPFTGTGTFITRLLQSGLIRQQDLRRKYLEEIHCNELVLLAYYVADVNIESVYHDLAAEKDYLRYDGISLTDTFELYGKTEIGQEYPMLAGNFEAMNREAQAPVRVIIGNPPYSAGQKSANDDAQNLKYPALDKRIEQTYVARVATTNKNSLYDSYIRAFRWATDRLKQNNEGGVIGFITNSKWLDGNATAGFRKCLEDEFTSIYVFDLKGAIRAKATEQARREGGNVFDIMTGVCIVILVYNPEKQGRADIQYCDIGDYLKRENKLKILEERRSIFSRKMQWTKITPDAHGDWLKQRSDLFGSFIVIGDKKDKGNTEKFFEDVYSRGLETSRDAWCYNFSKTNLIKNIKRTISFYNEQCDVVKSGHDFSLDPTQFSWTDPTKNKVCKGIKFSYNAGEIRNATYRPFCKEYLYFSHELNHRIGQWPQLFPTANLENKVICINGLSSRRDFTCLITNKITDLNLLEGGTQCFPLYYYKQIENQQANLFDAAPRYQRKDAISDWILKNIRSRFGGARSISKESIFYYVYGILHSPDYRQRFNDDLKKSLPRIPIVETVEEFVDFAEAGKKLADLHLNYETMPPYPDVVVTGAESGNFSVQKMKFAGRQGEWDKSRIIYNADIELGNIPLRAYDYVVNGRSAIEWLMESYRIKTDKDSGIVNDPNNWAKEHDKPRYILDLLLSVINLSLKTLEIVAGLPKLDWGEEQEE